MDTKAGRPTPLWVSIEGINGVGKTSAARAAAAMLGARCLLLDELTDSCGDTLPGRVIAALSAEGDPFLRTGYPVVETLALLALQVRKAERLAGRHLAGVDVVVEDRGLDSVAIYQAVVLCSQNSEASPEAVSRHVLSGARRWRRFPDATLLLAGDPAVCARRFVDRMGQPLMPADIRMIEQIDALYREAAANDPGRYTIIDVAGMSPQECAGAVQEALAALLDRQATPRASSPNGYRPPSITPVHRSCARGSLLSVEGITGVGKTYLTDRAVEALDDKPLRLDGFSQRASECPGLGEVLLRGLREASSEHPFMSGGTPMAEALLLLAIKRHDLDTVIPELSSGRSVVEGRSVDTTAVCQALLLHPHDADAALETAIALVKLASSYRPLPDLTILITDDPIEAIMRAQRRDRCVFTSAQATFMHDACALFERLAVTDPARYRVVDRRKVGEQEAAELIRAWIHGAQTDLGCVCEPWQGRVARCMCCGQRADTAAPDASPPRSADFRQITASGRRIRGA